MVFSHYCDSVICWILTFSIQAECMFAFPPTFLLLSVQLLSSVESQLQPQFKVLL